LVLERADPSDGPQPCEVSIRRSHRHAHGVVSAVFEPAERGDQILRSRTVGAARDDAAHQWRRSREVAVPAIWSVNMLSPLMFE
jgi:hypothetical protein